MQNRDAPPAPVRGLALGADPLAASPFETLAAFEALNRELNAVSAPSPDSFASVLSITTAAMRVIGRCADCCHWSLPLTATYADRIMPASAAMAYNEWIVWAWHVERHQHAHQPSHRAGSA